jgi:hypothetical protein
VPAMRHLQNQCADKCLHPRPGRAGGARFYLAVLAGQYLRPSSRLLMSGRTWQYRRERPIGRHLPLGLLIGICSSIHDACCSCIPLGQRHD